MSRSIPTQPTNFCRIAKIDSPKVRPQGEGHEWSESKEALECEPE
jgi:hypothetical protein